ncbi:MAG: GNAT family N-acetyltransferase [Saprospiraceae bacterium]|nr:GNAT family N-acetyltransferase [Saprospiraceae bacterium]
MVTDFFIRTGKLALGTRLRRLGEQFMEDAAKVLEMYGVSINPKWFPVFYVLSEADHLSITEIARQIGHTHPSVSQIVKEMQRKGIIVCEKSKQDARVNIVRLSDLGWEMNRRMQIQYLDVREAVEEVLDETRHDLWKAMEEIEYVLSKKDFFTRVYEKRKERERQAVSIIDYQSKHAPAFKALNEEWISKYYQLEKADYKVLDDPEGNIIAPGGHIFMAEYDGEVVGTCGLMKMADGGYEMVKMAVAPAARGKHIGWLLGQAIVEKAKALGAPRVYLESNTQQEPAINLYYKLGFERIVGPPSPYARCNIQMELKF